MTLLRQAQSPAGTTEDAGGPGGARTEAPVPGATTVPTRPTGSNAQRRRRTSGLRGTDWLAIIGAFAAACATTGVLWTQLGPFTGLLGYVVVTWLVVVVCYAALVSFDESRVVMRDRISAFVLHAAGPAHRRLRARPLRLTHPTVDGSQSDIRKGSVPLMKTVFSKRLGLAIAAILGAIGVSLLIPAIARPTVPDPMPAGINLGGLHLTPTSGTGGETPSFTADTACPTGTNLANVNTIDLGNVEQTISHNVAGAVATGGHFGTAFNTDMATVQALGGTPGTAESFLFLIDCRTGAGHGTYTDAVQVDYAAGGSWVVHGAQPTSPSPSASASASASASGSSSPSPSASESSSSPTPSESVSPSPTSGGSNLPVTGTDVLALAGIAVTTIAVGGGLRYAARRRGADRS